MKWHSESVFNKKNISLLIIVFVSTLLILTDYFTIETTSAVRAYINGESRYSKGQKDGARHLIMYIHSEDEKYWDSFLQELQVPLGDSAARVALMNNQEDSIIRKGFLQGENHFDDIDNMIWLFRNFKEISFMKRAIGIWKSGDHKIGQLLLLGENTRGKIESGQLSLQEKKKIAQQVDRLTLELTQLEREFSDVLGAAAREINGYLFLANILLTLVIIGSAGSYSMNMISRLNDSNEQFRATLQFGKMGSAELNLQTSQLTVSRELFHLLDVDAKKQQIVPLEEFLKTYVNPVYLPTIQEKILEGTMGISENAKSMVDTEFEMTTAQGRKIWIDAKGIFKGNKGLGILHDITDKKEAECEIVKEKELLKESEKQLKELLNRFEKVSDNIPGFIYEFRMRPDGTTHFPYASKGIREIYGLRPDEVLEDASPLFNRMHPDDIERIGKEVEHAAKTLTGNISEFRVNTPDGKMRWMKTQATVEPLPDGSLLWFGYTVEITELKTAMTELEKLLSEKEDLISVKDKFFSIISHDLRNPVTTLHSFIRLIETRIDELSKQEIEEMVRDINKRFVDTKALLDDLTTWGQSQLNSEGVSPMHFDLKKSIDSVTSYISDINSSKQIAIQYEGPNSLFVFADINQAEFIVRNLVSNAFKFTPHGGEIHISLKETKGQATLSIRDSGVGISSNDLRNIFQMGKVKSKLGTDGEKGTGLGLVLVKEFVEKNAGKITVESAQGEGTAFHISLPTAINIIT
jgi:PAS domain S-box-containing protein